MSNLSRIDPAPRRLFVSAIGFIVTNDLPIVKKNNAGKREGQ